MPLYRASPAATVAVGDGKKRQRMVKNSPYYDRAEIEDGALAGKRPGNLLA